MQLGFTKPQHFEIRLFTFYPYVVANPHASVDYPGSVNKACLNFW